MRKRLFRLPWRTRRQIGADVDDELAFHLDTRTEELVAAGMSRDVARALAVREFGDVDDARRYITTVDSSTEAAGRRSEIMREFFSDVAYALRKLRGTPVFTLAAVVTLALGIGANTVIFSVVDSVLLRPLPFADPDRLVRMRYTDGGQGDSGSPPDLADYRARATSFEGFGMLESFAMNLVRPSAEPERLNGARVSANWFGLLRVRPLLGRGFVDGEDREGAAKVVMLGEQVWRSRFNADSSIVGKSVKINGEPV